jgi:hypothetical protein
LGRGLWCLNLTALKTFSARINRNNVAHGQTIQQGVQYRTINPRRYAHRSRLGIVTIAVVAETYGAAITLVAGAVHRAAAPSLHVDNMGVYLLIVKKLQMFRRYHLQRLACGGP